MKRINYSLEYQILLLKKCPNQGVFFLGGERVAKFQNASVSSILLLYYD